MAAAAAALRLVRRRALLQPLLPRSCAKPRSPAAAASRPDVRRAHLWPFPPPSLLRHYTSKGCASPLPGQHRPGMQCPKQVIAASASSIPDSYRVPLSLLSVPLLIRHYSSKEGVLPPLNQSRRQKLLWLAIFMLWILNWRMWSIYVDYKRRSTVIMRLVDKLKDMKKIRGMMVEEVKTLKRAFHLLEAGFDDEASDLFHQALDDCLKAITLYEEVSADFSKATEDCKELRYDVLEWCREFCKENEDFTKTMREKLNTLPGFFETKKTMKKHTKFGLVDV
ncbi:hypothetical protein ACP70R_032969 [Stipagrostis hirtigluma subsp. patula]